eukprot:4305643-Amphidinium_carterae.1
MICCWWQCCGKHQDLGIKRAFKRSALGAWTKAASVELEQKPAVLHNVWAHLKLSDADFEAEALRATKAHEIHMLFRPNKRGLVPAEESEEDEPTVPPFAFLEDQNKECEEEVEGIMGEVAKEALPQAPKTKLTSLQMCLALRLVYGSGP